MRHPFLAQFFVVRIGVGVSAWPLELEGFPGNRDRRQLISSGGSPWLQAPAWTRLSWAVGGKEGRSAAWVARGRDGAGACLPPRVWSARVGVFSSESQQKEPWLVTSAFGGAPASIEPPWRWVAGRFIILIAPPRSSSCSSCAPLRGRKNIFMDEATGCVSNHWRTQEIDAMLLGVAAWDFESYTWSLLGEGSLHLGGHGSGCRVLRGT